MKRRAKYRIRIVDEAHLVDRGGFTLSWLKAGAIAAVIMLFFIVVGVAIVWFTPLKKRLPGYMPPDQRALTEENYLRVDSLHRLYLVNQAYIDNLVKVLDTQRVPDEADTTGRALPLVPDSLLVSSEAEKEFMKKMEEAGYIITIPEEYDDAESR